MGKKRTIVAVTCIVAAAVNALIAGNWAAAGTGPTVALSSSTAKPGDQVIVTLTGWTAGILTVSVCGNAAARGSEDCALRSSEGTNATRDGRLANGPANPPGQVLVQLGIEKPPRPCPCVIRVSTPTNDVVRTVPIILVGVPTGPIIPPDPVGSTLEVTASLDRGPSSWFDRLRASLGGRAQLTLALVITNEGSSVVSQITASAALGRDGHSGEPLPVPVIGTLGPGESRRYLVPVRVSAPSFGHYVVFGSVSATGVPVEFAAPTDSTPILLLVFGIALLADLAALAGRRARRRRPARDRRPTMGRTAGAAEHRSTLNAE